MLDQGLIVAVPKSSMDGISFLPEVRNWTCLQCVWLLYRKC